MNNDAKLLIKYTIALPLALKVFELDQKQFENLYAGNVYLNMTDSIIERIKNDIAATKEQLFDRHRIIVQKLNTEDGLTKYKLIQGNKSYILSYASDQLKAMTETVMDLYLHGSKAAPFKNESRAWKMWNIEPPDVDSS